MRIFVTISVAFFAHNTCSNKHKHAVVLLHGRELWGMPFTHVHFVLQKNAFSTIFNVPLSFSTNYGITVFK